MTGRARDSGTPSPHFARRLKNGIESRVSPCCRGAVQKKGEDIKLKHFILIERTLTPGTGWGEEQERPLF